mgnify:CR=1 FL=1
MTSTYLAPNSVVQTYNGSDAAGAPHATDEPLFAPISNSSNPNASRVCYFFDSDIGNYHYGPGHPMKPTRIRMCHSLVMNYGLYKRMEIFRAKPATKREMSQFHTDEYVDFLHRVTPETVQAGKIATKWAENLIEAIAASRNPPLARLLFALGVRHVGESYLQEALPKQAELADLDLCWHFIGSLQANKSRAVASHFGLKDQGRAGDRWLLDTARWTWMVKLSLHLELELMNQLREQAEEEAIRVFARNLHDSLGGDLMQLSLQLAGNTPREQMLDLAYEVIAKTKNLVYTLEPKNENENLVEQLESHFYDFK